MSTAASLDAQEALRMSLASAEAARARREAASAAGYYNLKLGPTQWTVSAGLGLEGNDNIRLEPDAPKADLIFHPLLNAQMVWPVSQVNSLNLTIGAGYSAYTLHSEFNRFYVSPGSELSFDLYVGDFWINLHDRFSISENNYQDPTVVGSADYALLQNAIGQTTTWDLNKILARFGYDHVNYDSIFGAGQGAAGQPDGESEVFSASAGYRFRPEILAGLELGGSLFSYSPSSASQFFTDGTEWNAGAFIQAQFSQYLQGRASAGYTVYSPENTGPADTGDFTGIYAELDLTHRLNQYVDYTLSAGRTINLAFYGGTVDLYFVRWQAQWHFLQKFNLATTFEFEHGTQLGFGGETFDRYGPGLSLGRALSSKLTASLNYQYFWRDSDLPERNYSDNILTLNGTYQF